MIFFFNAIQYLISPMGVDADELKEYFSSYGNVMEHQIMLDHKTGRSRGFGFVTFDNEDAVEKIFSHGQIHELGGKQVNPWSFVF